MVSEFGKDLMRAGNKSVVRIDVWKHVASRQRAMRQFNTIKQKAEEASGEGADRSLTHSLFLTEAPARKKVPVNLLRLFLFHVNFP